MSDGAGFETRKGSNGSVLILRRGLTLPPDVTRDPERFLEDRGRASGRGALARIDLGGGAALLIKKYRHGGLLRGVLPDVFAGSGRMLRDLAASERARSRGIPCAAVAGLILVRRAGPLWSGYLLTEEIPGALTLDEALAGAPEPRRLAALAVGTVRRLHDAGVLHRDLNLKNLLVQGGEVLVIDLDGARLVESPSPARRFANLSRLDRSYEKLFRGAGPLSHGDRRALLADYCGEDTAMRSEMEARIASHKRAVARHRRLWK